MSRTVLRAALVVLVFELALGCETVGDVLTSAVSAGGSAGGDAGENGAGGNAGENGVGGGVPSAPYTGTPSDLTAGDAQSCFIDAGRLFCFGRGAEGQLGTGRLDDEPRAIRAGSSNDYVMVRSGGSFTCALRTTGSLECTGEGEFGALGDGARSSRPSLEPVVLDQSIVRFSTGQAHVCAITSDGALYCWGKNAEGQLAQDDPFPAVGVDRERPVQVAPGARFQDVSAGQGHTCAVDQDGVLLCWGRNSQNQLGLGNAADDQFRTPQRVGDEDDWIRVAAGQDHSCAQKRSGALYCWGWNGAGQLGLGDQEDRDRPTLVLSDDVLDFDLDTFHTCLIRSAGAFCSGRGIEGALGTGTADQLSPTLATSTGAALQVSVGRFHTCLRESGTIRCTGENESGRLGVADLERRSAFTEIASPSP